MALSIRSAGSLEDDEEVADWVDGIDVDEEEEEEEEEVDIWLNRIKSDSRRHGRELVNQEDRSDLFRIESNTTLSLSLSLSVCACQWFHTFMLGVFVFEDMNELLLM